MIHSSFQTYEPASDAELLELERWLNCPLPSSYRSFLKISDGVMRDDSVSLYSAADVRERNETYEVSRYLPEYFAIGDNGGCEFFLIPRAGTSVPVFIASMSANSIEDARKISNDFDRWLTEGCAHEEPLTELQILYAKHVDVWLERAPALTLKMMAMAEVRAALLPNKTVSEISKLFLNTPCVLLANRSYGSVARRCQELNDKFNCLSLYETGSTTKKLPFV